MLRFSRTYVLAAALIIAPGLARGANSLAPTSPFMPPAAVGAPQAENNPLELRGIMVDDSGYRFSIFDPTRHAGTWARLNEAGHDFVIKSHDVARDVVTLDYQGRVLTLALRNAKVAIVAPQPLNMSGGPQPTPGGGVGPVVLNPSPADEVARFNRVKEEIARRRALREQGGNQGGPQIRK